MNAKQSSFLPLAAVIVAIDQLGKLHASRSIEVGARVPLVGDFVALTHLPSAGGALGLFRNWSPTLQLAGFALLSIVALAVIITFYRGLAPGERGSAAALGAILGGIVSNGIDRVRYGSGIDFIHLGSIETDGIPDFNLADVAIVLGVATLIIELLATEMAARASERPRP
ncbi:MAG TPA: signal peptidase II [Deltaproteobacteria bacterium]|nr:signal peptidase II [Deltaproteobacteria bacterium]